MNEINGMMPFQTERPNWNDNNTSYRFQAVPFHPSVYRERWNAFDLVERFLSEIHRAAVLAWSVAMARCRLKKMPAPQSAIRRRQWRVHTETLIVPTGAAAMGSLSSRV